MLALSHCAQLVYSTKGRSGVVSHLVSTGQTPSLQLLELACTSIYLPPSSPACASSEAYEKALPGALGSWADGCALAVSYRLHMSLLNSMCGLGVSPAQGHSWGCRACKQSSLLFKDPCLYCNSESWAGFLQPYAAPVASHWGEAKAVLTDASEGLQDTSCEALVLHCRLPPLNWVWLAAAGSGCGSIGYPKS